VAKKLPSYGTLVRVCTMSVSGYARVLMTLFPLLCVFWRSLSTAAFLCQPPAQPFILVHHHLSSAVVLSPISRLGRWFLTTAELVQTCTSIPTIHPAHVAPATFVPLRFVYSEHSDIYDRCLAAPRMERSPACRLGGGIGALLLLATVPTLPRSRRTSHAHVRMRIRPASISGLCLRERMHDFAICTKPTRTSRAT